MVAGAVPVEELDLPIRAYHVLKVLNMDFIEQINLAAGSRVGSGSSS